MIFLQREKAEFAKTKAEFQEAYLGLTNEMFATFKAKGKTRDAGSPVHHRMSPIAMLSIGQAKMRRIESLLSSDEWEPNPKRLADVIEECTDVANYVLYVAALCRMLQMEAKE